jgi:hypothetical protein
MTNAVQAHDISGKIILNQLDNSWKLFFSDNCQ